MKQPVLTSSNVLLKNRCARLLPTLVKKVLLLYRKCVKARQTLVTMPVQMFMKTCMQLVCRSCQGYSCALENAASIAGMFLTTECVIVEKKEDKPEMPMGAPGMGGMGGMM